ncbi:hypothetical protein H5410_006444 [Solanum commersonii]|uniref:Uncharacterized protein n=1 Tax=Solanum commersonii TaxID=4109 RepID=A0A9J6AAH3_SOLCO|nr:hypothetical protein H5410_006444 [Solanum commersonii]
MHSTSLFCINKEPCPKNYLILLICFCSALGICMFVVLPFHGFSGEEKVIPINTQTVENAGHRLTLSLSCSNECKLG